MIPPYTVIVCWLALVGSTACAQSPRLGEPAPYRFDQPAAQFELPSSLHEISGLTVLDDRHLGAVQDEQANLYVIDLETGEVVGSEDFGKDDDYEGLERVGSRVYALRSDGTLFEIEDWTAPKRDARKLDTDLSSRYDTEGLAYDAANHRLLIACKEYAGKNLKRQRAIYAYDLEAGHLLPDPVFTISLGALERYRPPTDALSEGLRKLAAPLADLEGFKPSALAFHPITGHLYVLSSVMKAVVVLDATGDLFAVHPLPEALFKQPEGITFLADGDLFISNEGGEGNGTLLRFSYQPE